MLKNLGIVFGCIIGFFAIIIFGAYFIIVKPLLDVVKEATGPSRAVIEQRMSPYYVYEGGRIAFRPKTRGEIVVANIVTLGLIGRQEWLTGRVIDEADLGTFQVLAETFAKDAKHAYFGGRSLAGADVSSFRPLDYHYANDKTHIWHEGTEISVFPDLSTATIKAYSDHIFSVDEQAYFLHGDLQKLPEMPKTAVHHHCRKWYQMNDALWFGAIKVDLPKEDITVIDCDGAIHSGPEGEDVNSNRGLLFQTSSAIYNVDILGNLRQLQQFDDRILESRVISPDYKTDLFMVYLKNHDVVMVDIKGKERMQNLGNFPNLDLKSIEELGSQALFINDYLYFYQEDRRPERPEYFTPAGPAKKVAEYFYTQDVVYWRGYPIQGVTPDTFKHVIGDYATDGAACFVSGRYIGDLDPQLETTNEIYDHCYEMNDDAFLYYNGLKIYFEPKFYRTRDRSGTVQGGRNKNNLYDYHMGRVVIKNPANTPVSMDKGLYESLSVWVFSGGEYIKVDVDKPDLVEKDGGYPLAPKGIVSWPVKVQSDDHDLQVNVRLQLNHMVDKLKYGVDPIHIFNVQHLYGATDAE